MPPPPKQSGFQGAGSEEPPIATPGGSAAGGDLASAIESATKAEGELTQATEKRQRLNRDDPAVKAAKSAADALKEQTDTEDRLRVTVDDRTKAQAGTTSGAPTRHNPDLDDAMGLPQSQPHRPAGDEGKEKFRDLAKPPREEKDGGPDGTDSRMAAALRAERELFSAMRERLGLAKTLAGTPSVPASGGGGSRGYAGPAAVGAERAGASKLEQEVVKLERANATMRAAVSLPSRSKSGDMEIHDPRRAESDSRVETERRVKFRRDLEEKRAGESGGEGVTGRIGKAVGGGAVGSALSSLGRHADTVSNAAALKRDPYLTENDRFWSMAGQVPGISQLRRLQQELQKAGKDTGGLGHERAMLGYAEYDARVRQPAEAFGPGWHMDVRERDARFMAYAGGFDMPLQPRTGRPDEPKFERVERPALPVARRESVADARRYREERALMPARDAEFGAKREVFALGRRSEEMDFQRSRQTEEITRLEGVRKAALQRAEVDMEDGGVSQLEAKAEAADASRGILTHRQRLTKMDDEKRGLDEQLAGARSRQYDASRSVRQAELGQLQDREVKARGQATNLGMLGVDGRMQATLAKQLVDQIGAENAPGQILSMAHAAFPEMVEQQAMKAGQKVQPQFQQMAPEEYRDSVSDITKQVDEAIAAIRAQEKSDLGRSLLDLLQLVQGMSSKNGRLADELEAFKKVYESEQTLRGK